MRNKLGQFVQGNIPWIVGRKHTEKTKRKIKIARKRQGSNVWNKGKKGYKTKPCSKERKRKIGEAQIGEKNHYWKGNKVGYSGLHSWILKNFIKLKQCEFCGNNNKIEWANKTGRYLRKRSDWLCLCKNCHKKYDKQFKKAIEKKFKKIWWTQKKKKRFVI